MGFKFKIIDQHLWWKPKRFVQTEWKWGLKLLYSTSLRTRMILKGAESSLFHWREISRLIIRNLLPRALAWRICYVNLSCLYVSMIHNLCIAPPFGVARLSCVAKSVAHQRPLAHHLSWGVSRKNLTYPLSLLLCSYIKVCRHVITSVIDMEKWCIFLDSWILTWILGVPIPSHPWADQHKERLGEITTWGKSLFIGYLIRAASRL